MLVFRADTERELYDDSALIDMRGVSPSSPCRLQSRTTLTIGSLMTETPTASE